MGDAVQLEGSMQVVVADEDIKSVSTEETPKQQIIIDSSVCEDLVPLVLLQPLISYRDTGS